MNLTITGPRSVGKSTISKIVAEKLGMKHFSSDELGEQAMKHVGGLDKAIKSGAIEGFIKEKGYTLILDVFHKNNNFVFDLSGGSINSRKFKEASEEVRKTAKEHSTIIGLLPSKNFEESVHILFKREKERAHFKEMDEKELFEKTKEDYSKFPVLFDTFCNFIIYTNQKTPEEIAEEIISKLNS
jgi:shikimate kinase